MTTKYSQRAAGILAILADRPVAYHPKLATVIGVKETIFVCQLLYWDGRGARGDGFVWKVQAEITEETGLSRYEQETVRKNLIEHGIMEEKRMGIPAKLYYRLNFETLAAVVEKAYPADNDGVIPLPSLRKPCKLDEDVSPNFLAENLPTITEITSESTAEKTTEKESPSEKPGVLDAYFTYSQVPKQESWTVPAAAGGADDWAPAVDAFAGLVGLDPSTVPKGTRREWSRQIQEVGRDWQAGPSLLTEIISKVPESELYWKTYTSPHGAKADLGVLIGQHRSGGIRKAKKTNGGTQASAIAGIAAYKEKMRREVVEAEFVVMGEAL